MRPRTIVRAVVAIAAAAACLVGAAAAFGAVRFGPSHPTGQATVTTGPEPSALVDRTPGLVQPGSLTVDGSLSPDRARQEVRLAQQLYTFWNTGDRKYLEAAVATGFRDNTLPTGRPQGSTGPVFASENFRAAVPDLTCELADLLITGDKITARLVFRGHFTGTFNGVNGTGQSVDFNAIDIQHVGTDKIVEDWHIEDNQTLMAQLGIVGGK